MTLVTMVLGALWLGWAWLWTGGSNDVFFEPKPRSAPRTLTGVLRLLNVLLLFAIGMGLQWTAGRRVGRLYSVPFVAATFGFATWWPIHAKGSSLPGSGYLIGGVAALVAGAAVALADMPMNAEGGDGRDDDASSSPTA